MADDLSLTFAALADPTRRAMLARLSEGEFNVSELAKPFLNDMSLPAITKHLKVLEKAGLIIKTKDAQYRSCKINAAPLQEATNWMEQYREMWEESFDRLDDYLRTLQAKIKLKEKNMAKAAKANELRLVRALNAPVKLVWETFTDDKHISQWWGPRGFSLTTKSKNVTPGGVWEYTMHGPDGVDYPNYTTYHVVEKYKKLVYDHGASGEGAKPLFRVTVTFEEFKGKTVMDFTMALETPEAAAEIKKFIKQAGGDSTWDRMAEFIEEQQSKKDVFVINRSFEADIKTIFDMWSQPEHVSRWLPPTGASMKFLKADIRAGGESHYQMQNADGSSMFGKIFYKEITPTSRMVYTQCFSDKDGNICKPPFAPTWPNAMLTTVTFTEEGDGETRVTVQWEVEGEASDIERKTFHDAKAGMTGGWTGSFDKLEEALKR